MCEARMPGAATVRSQLSAEAGGKKKTERPGSLTAVLGNLGTA